MEIGVFEKSCIDFHLAFEDGLHLLTHVLPRRDGLGTRGEDRIRGNDPPLLLLLENRFALSVPTSCEPALVLVGPLHRNMVRRMGSAGCKVDEERLVRSQGLLHPNPVDRVIGKVFGEVVTLLRCLVRLDRRDALVQRRVILIVLPADESVEMLESAFSRRPRRERSHRGCLPRRNLVTLAELRRRVSVEFQRHRQCGFGIRPQAGKTRSRGSGFGDRSHADRMMVAPAQKSGAGRSTQCRRVKPRVREPITLQSLSSRCVRWSSEGTARAISHVVQQDHQNIGCAGRR